MFAVDLPHYRRAYDRWKRAPVEHRIVKRNLRDELGRPCHELWSFGVCRCRIVDLGNGLRKLYADRGMPNRPDYGKISFKTWTEPEVAEGDGVHRPLPMVPRQQEFRI